MKAKLISLAIVIVVVISLVTVSQAAEVQVIGNCDQFGSDCDCETGHCRKIWRCLYGQMVSDGFGGTFRVYGYPRPPCCGNQKCGYPIWGMGGGCPTSFPRNGNQTFMQRSNAGY